MINYPGRAHDPRYLAKPADHAIDPKVPCHPLGSTASDFQELCVMFLRLDNLAIHSLDWQDTGIDGLT
jgi:hypothetical protein